MTRLPRFSVENPVLVGVLMFVLIVGGLYSGATLIREMFPESRPNAVSITAPYPGASPEEVERGLALRLEQAVKDLDDVEKVETTISEGLCLITVELESGVRDLDQAVIDFQAEIDAIPADELPEEAEEIRVTRVEPLLPVISVAIFGQVDERTLKAAGLELRDDLLALDGVTKVMLNGTRKGEISVVVDPERLISYGLSLDRVANAIRQANLDLPGGQLKTDRANIAIRTLGETDSAELIAETIVDTTRDGQLVRVRDLGEVIDGFVDSDTHGRFMGAPGVDITVSKTPDQDAVKIAALVQAYVAGRMGKPYEPDFATRLQNLIGIQTPAQKVYERALREPLAEISGDLQLGTYSNLSRLISDRLELLQRNGALGLGLVFVSLLVFLNWRVAFWVMMGLVISIAGAIMFMQAIGATLNLISMFGLIVVLGIIVDDAIVVGENIFARFEMGESPEDAAVNGAVEVTWPVTVAVLTTIGAFAPLMFIDGIMGDFMGVLPVVVMCALTVSLFEALLILPSHMHESLGAIKRKQVTAAKKEAEHRAALGIGAEDAAPRGRWAAIKHGARELLATHLPRRYAAFLDRAVRYRYVTLATAIACLTMAIGLVYSERVEFVFIQKMDAETLICDLEMPVGTPVAMTESTVLQIEEAILGLPEGELRNLYVIVGGGIDFGPGGGLFEGRSHLAQCIIELGSVEHRDRNSEQILTDLRQRTAQIPGASAIRFSSMQGGPGGPEIDIELTGDDLEALEAASERFKSELTRFDGVFDIADNFDGGRREVRLELLDSARALDMTNRQFATEVRGAFYGIDARTIQRQREDIDIRVRYPDEHRSNLSDLEQMRIGLPDGRMVPLSEVASLKESEGYSTIRRIDQRRSVNVTADIYQETNNAEKVIAALAPVVEELEAAHPGLEVVFAGNKRETQRSMESLNRDFLIALAVIYVMLAGLFKSYFQPLIVLAAVPFGITGAIVGHWVMGYPLTILSVIGVVALTGIVVNDSLILVDFVNQEVRRGRTVLQAVVIGAQRRLRPILLTSATTILGLAPLMAEQSFQARFLIPMAISISFGLAFATFLTLVVVPSIYMIFNDFRNLFSTRVHSEDSGSVAASADAQGA